MAIYVRNEKGVLESYKVVGLKGKDGVTPNIQIGTVTTLEAGEQATVVNSGTLENPIFDFGIPRGEGGGGSASIDDSTLSTEKTWSSAKIEDFVLTNDNTIWLDQSGESLKIDGTKEGYLREIEIFGNTIQSEEDLSDIRHLGELYVDELGQPILDDLGREQYKIEVESYNNSNIIRDDNIVYEKYLNLSNGKEEATYDDWHTKDFIKVNSNLIYYYSFIKLDESVGYRAWVDIFTYDDNKNFLKTFRIYYSSNQFELDENVEFIKVNNGGITGDKSKFKLVISKTNTDLSYNPSFKNHKTTILLPCQLMKVGDVADRLYWDNEKDRYVVEKKVTNFLYSDYQNKWMNFSINDTEVCIASNGTGGFAGVTCNNKIIFTFECLPKSNTYAHIYLYFSKEMLEEKGYEFSYEGARKYLINNGSTIYGELINYQLIETNITEQIKLPTYLNTTYVAVTGGLQGTIKSKAPVDSSAVVNSLVQENKELKATNEEQDELINATMLATDEMFMMLEPLLASAISEGGVNSLVNMYVAMVQRGLKTIDEVPVRYREQVREIVR